ncbi:MAG TPA: hypothetical protein VHZ51_19370 [Ktedonobacteraceae bacterium]|nr:hypothetical protein [Ktedonobacteraceae bacterium]
MRHVLFIRATTPLLILAVILCSVFWFIPQASARSLATTVVTNCTDMGLRAAINSASPGDTITFRCPTNPTSITLNNTLVIQKNLTLDGSGQSITLSGGGNVGVLDIRSVQFTLKALTLANGNNYDSKGGGIYNNGTVSISNSTIANNKAIAPPHTSRNQ